MKMGDDEFKAVVLNEINLCKDYIESEVARKRALAYDYYCGQPYGNEVEGRSKVVSQDVQQTIDAAVPAVVKTFVASDKAVQFEPRGPEDVKSAEQATDLCNYLFYTQNNGFQLVHDCIKDGLLQITGMFKWFAEDQDTSVKETYMGLDEGQWTMLLNDPAIEVTAHSEMPIAGPTGEVMVLHAAEVRRKKTVKRYRVCVVPPEEQLISPRALSQDVDEAPFIGHATLKTKSQLLEMGYSEADLDGITTHDDMSFSIVSGERTERNLSMTDRGETTDPSMKRYRYYECYIRSDFDGDGIAELRRVCMVSETILHNEETDHIPLAYWSPKVMPHEPIGQSMAEEIMDLQYEKSMLRRQANDNLYLSNAPRLEVASGVEIDDVLNNVPGGIIRTDAPGKVNPIAVPFVANHAFTMIEYLDAEIETRTGVSRLFQGIDPNSLNKTATGVNALMNAAQARIELIARNFAENALKPMFKGLLYLLGKYQDKELTIRLKNNFVPIDPRAWTTEYDMTVNVGLGTGTKDQQLQGLMALGQYMQMVGQSPFGQHLLDAKKAYNFGQKLSELNGFKDVSIFLNDPDQSPPPPPPGPPESVQVAQIKAQADKEKAQMDAQASQAELQQKGQMDQAALAQEAQLEMQKAQIQDALERHKMRMQADLERYKAELKAEVDAHVGAMRAQADAQRGFQEGMNGA